MPEAIIEEPPKADEQTVKTIVKSAGDKFREAFAKLEPNAFPADPEKVESKLEEQQQSPEPTEEQAIPSDGASSHAQPPSSQPSSALEAAIGPEEVQPPKEELDFEKVEKPTQDNWHQARTRIKELNKEVEKLKSAPPTQPDNSAIEALAQERDEYKQRLADQESRLKAINAEYSEEYQGLQKDREKALNKIASRMKYIGASEKAQDLVEALNLPDSRFKTQQVKEALSELETDDKAAIRVLIEGLDGVDEKISDFRKDLPGQWDKIQSQHSARVAEEQAEGLKAIDREFGKVVEHLPKEIIRLRQVPEDTPGAAEWNKPIQEAIGRALNALKPNGTDFQQTVQIAVKGELFDSLWNDHLAQHKELQAARARLKELDGASPDFKGGVKPSTQPKKTPSQKFHEAMAAQATSE